MSISLMHKNLTGVFPNSLWLVTQSMNYGPVHMFPDHILGAKFHNRKLPKSRENLGPGIFDIISKRDLTKATIVHYIPNQGPWVVATPFVIFFPVSP